MKHSGSSSAETSLSLLIVFDAVMTAATDSLADMSSTVESCAINNSQKQSSLVDDGSQAITNSGGVVSQKCIK